MSRKEMCAGIRMLASMLNEAPTVDKLPLLRQIAADSKAVQEFWLGQLDEESASMALRVDWTRLFRGLSPNYGPKPPYELVYEPHSDEISGLLSLKQLYNNAGLDIAEDAHNRPDYLGFELEFAAYLLEHEGETELGTTYSQFCEQHLSWIRAFCNEAKPFAKTAFYSWHLEALEAFSDDMAAALCE